MADAPKPKRRLPFKPTALRQKSDSKPTPKSDEEDDDGLSLFKRSAEVFPLALAEQERRIKRKQAEREKGSQAHAPDAKNIESLSSFGESQNSKGKRNDSDDHEDLGYGREIGTPPSKRSRTSDDSPQSTRLKSSPTKRGGDETPSKRITRAAASRTPRKQEPLPSKPIISIDDSDDDPDDDDHIYEASPIRKPRRQSSEREVSPLAIDDDDDDPFAEQKPDGAEEEEDEFQEYIQRAKERKMATDQEENQTVNVFVTSEILGASNRQFRFTLEKATKVLRCAWMDLHRGRVHLPPSELENVFLTWRGHRLYDFTTLRSLDLPGEFKKTAAAAALGGGDDDEGFKEQWTNVHMQMWTQDLWDKHEKQAARQRRHDLGEFSDDEEGAGGGGDGAPKAQHEEAQQQKKIKVLLKTKTDEPLKTSVRPSTTIGTIMELFRKMRGLAPDAPITLMFDGDELEEDTTVENADIGDMETIEVYMR